MHMFEFISENPDNIALLIATFAGLFGLVKWLDARTLTLKNERYDRYIQLIKVLSGSKDSKISMTEQIASVWLLLEYKEYYPITLKILDNPDLERMTNEPWQEFILPQIKLVIKEIDPKR